ncbi:hypothetical protein B0O99DRAFT_649784 [Bisporella sp. PMI_857]|nr:hypothetical protein B0O99DRAFT_649784 [Bisporella sp. PMI_857]
MSVAMASQSQASELDKHKSKSSKRHRSEHGEKKRKRENGDEQTKSKKHKSELSIQASQEDITTDSKKHKSLQLVQLAEEDTSPFHTQTSSLYLPLAPVSQKYPLEGLCAEHISPLILTYYPPLGGVILAYSNPRYAEEPFENDGHSTLLHNINEYAVSWTWVTADFLLFKPEKGVWLEGYINLQNEGHLGVVCWNLFNASIERKRLPEDWKWIGVEDEDGEDVDGMGETYAENGVGYWVDSDGNKINGQLKFRVREIETSHDKERGFLSIEGTMLDDEAENVLLQEEVEQKTSKETAGRRLGGLKARGATSLGVPVEEGLLDGVEKTQKRKKF